MADVKETVISEVTTQLTAAGLKADEDRLSHLYDLVLLQVKAEVAGFDNDRLEEIKPYLVEIIFRISGDENKKVVASINRGDTSISYKTTDQIQDYLADYLGQIQKLFGNRGFRFF